MTTGQQGVAHLLESLASGKLMHKIVPSLKKVKELRVFFWPDDLTNCFYFLAKFYLPTSKKYCQKNALLVLDKILQWGAKTAVIFFLHQT